MLRAFGFIPLLSVFSVLFAVNEMSVFALAAAPHETFYFAGTPSQENVRDWSILPGHRGFLIEAEDPLADELKPLAQLRGADRIQVEVQSYPSESNLDVWKSLASQGVEFVARNRLGRSPGLPNDDEVRRLNEVGFSRCRFVIDYYPDPADAQRLAKLTCRSSITFAVHAYPKFGDKAGLAEIPLTIPLLFAADYWPWYTHMDLFNMLPHRKSLRVINTLPADEALPYLRNIKLLDDVQISMDYDPQASDWHKFDGLPMSWSSQGHVPSAEALAAYAQGSEPTHPRKLIIDADGPWTPEERARIERSPLGVEWIHAAPFSPRRNSR